VLTASASMKRGQDDKRLLADAAQLDNKADVLYPAMITQLPPGTIKNTLMTDTYVQYSQSGEIVLNNTPLRVNGEIVEELQNIFGRKVQQGDPGPDDHPINSTISVEDNTGGMGTLKRRSDEDTGRYWFSTLWTMSRGVLALHPYTQSVTVSGITVELVFPLDQLGGKTYIAFGQKLKVWNELTLTADDPGGSPITFTGSPVARGNLGDGPVS
jgi:hypothetical protein